MKSGWFIRTGDTIMHSQTILPGASRRDFLKAGATAVAGIGLTTALAPPVHAASSDTLKIALIGCGSRGTGAAVQALGTAGPTTLWSMADTFSDRVEPCLSHINRELADLADSGKKSIGTVDVPKDRQFTGL